MQYPFQTYRIKRSQLTLGVDYQLYAPDETPECSASPLEMHKDALSRFVLTLVDKTNDTIVTPRANIPCRDIPCIKLKTEIAMHELLKKQSSSVNTGSTDDVMRSGPAFTTVLPYGEFKGKTPATVLIESPAAKDNLAKFRQNLQTNIEKYPGNKKHIDAIDQAIQLLEIGELTASAAPVSAPASTSFFIYKTEYKHMAAKDETGNHLIYTISMRFDSGRTYPFVIEITNCYAPLSHSSTGLVQPIMEKATRTVKSSVSLTDTEFVGLVAHLNNIKEYFELTNFKPMLALAQKYGYKHE